MITIIKGTNRKESTTARITYLLKTLVENKGAAACILDLADLPSDLLQPTMYDERSPEFMEIVQRTVAQSTSFIFVIPEYNGSYPGVLKLFIDALPIELLRGKYASIVGLSDGHAGNIRGQEHLTGVLHHLKMHVHYHKPKLSSITKSFDSEGKLNSNYMKLLEEHVELMVK